MRTYNAICWAPFGSCNSNLLHLHGHARTTFVQYEADEVVFWIALNFAHLRIGILIRFGSTTRGSAWWKENIPLLISTLRA